MRRLDTAPVTPLILPSYGSSPRRGGASGIAALPFATPVTPVRTEVAANGSSFRAGQLVAAGTAAAVIAAVATAFTPGGGGTLLGSGFTFAEAQQGISAGTPEADGEGGLAVEVVEPPADDLEPLGVLPSTLPDDLRSDEPDDRSGGGGDDDNGGGDDRQDERDGDDREGQDDRGDRDDHGDEDQDSSPSPFPWRPDFDFDLDDPSPTTKPQPSREPSDPSDPSPTREPSEPSEPSPTREPSEPAEPSPSEPTEPTEEPSTPPTSEPSQPPSPSLPPTGEPSPPPTSEPPAPAPDPVRLAGLSENYTLSLLGIKVLGSYTLSVVGEPGSTATVTYGGSAAGSVTFGGSGAASITLGRSLVDLKLSNPLIRVAYSDGTPGAPIEEYRDSI